MTTKVYRLNDHDFVAAGSLEAAVEWMCEKTGVSREETLDDAYAPHEIPEEQMRTLTVADEESGDPSFPKTFAEHLEQDHAGGRGAPFLFATTEW